MKHFLWGALAIAAWNASLFFLRYWRVTRDRLFAYFFMAFGALGLNWVGLAAFDVTDETRHYVFLVRLAAFVLIIVGIVEKNRRA